MSLGGDNNASVGRKFELIELNEPAGTNQEVLATARGTCHKPPLTSV